MPDSPPRSIKAPLPPGCLHVRCAECFAVLMVGPGMSQFVCPKCQLAQRLPPEMLPLLGRMPGERPLAQGIDPTKLQLPCASCKAILNVPYGLTRFKCPQCDSDLTVDGPLPPPPPPLPAPPVPRIRPVAIPIPTHTPSPKPEALLPPPPPPPPPLPAEPEEINEVGSDNEPGCSYWYYGTGI